MKRVFIFLIVFLLIPSFTYANWGPWEVKEASKGKPEAYENLLLSSIRFYQRVISPALHGNKCNFRPSCSEYGYQAFKKYSDLRGIIMMFDRLMRCHYWTGMEPYKFKSGRYLDPISDNDFWD